MLKRSGFPVAESQQAVSGAQNILERPTILQPYMRKPRARAGVWNVMKEVRFGVRLGFAHDDGGARVGIAEFNAAHLMAATLYDVGQAAEIGARGLAFYTVFLNIGLPCIPPNRQARGGEPRRLNVALSNCTPLSFL